MIATHEVKQLIGGTWIDAADGRTYEDTDPFTGEVKKRVRAPYPNFSAALTTAGGLAASYNCCQRCSTFN